MTDAVTDWLIDAERGHIVARLVPLLDLANPLTGDPWGIGPISIADVEGHRLTSGVSGTEHPCVADGPGDFCRDCEIARIAYLAEHGWPPIDIDPQPIGLDVGVYDFVPTWPLLDGNHRVAAATVRGESTIDIEVAGDWERAIALLVYGLPLDLVLDGGHRDLGLDYGPALLAA